jgi:hypothetical protein
MMLTLKPRGRGNWSTVTLIVSGARAAPLLIRVGQILTLGDVQFRICKVSP